MLREIGFLQYTTQLLEGVAAVVRGRADSGEAARLFGAAEALRERIGSPSTGAPPRLRERELASLRGELGEAAFVAAWAEGRALAEEDALDRAQRAVSGG